jgi:hypothetical protein
MRLRIAFVIIIIFMFGQGCSVYMAANQPDKKDVSVFNTGTPRTHVIAEAGRPRHTKENADGTLTDTFVFVQGYSSGSKAGRALFHGAADFLTLGLWEVIGTPVEAVADGTEVQVEVHYDADEKVRNIIALTGDEALEGIDSKGAGTQVQPAAKIMEADEPEEGPKVAAVAQEAPITRVGLRREPTQVSNRSDISAMLVEYNFFELSRNTHGSFMNDLVDNNDGTVTDSATGLMWQKSGSLERMDNLGAKKYVKQLNRKHFAGYYDWRMPTIEELASLLSRRSNQGVHLAPEFETHQFSCWSADKYRPQSNTDGYWIVNFKQGQILQASFLKPSMTMNIGWHGKNATNYVKAVRSVR